MPRRRCTRRCPPELGCSPLAQARLDTTVVEQAFEHLHEKMTQLVADSADDVTTGTANVMHHPENGVGATLQNWRAQIEATLATTFDPNRSDSAIGALNAVMRDAGERQTSVTRRLLDPAADDSPLGHVLCRVREQISLVLDAITHLAENVAADHAGNQARATAMERSAVKGIAYEQQVADLITTIAAGHGDVAEAVGRTPGSNGSRVGDLTVDIAVPDTSPATRYAVEIKDKRMSVRAILAELDAAKRNREAGAAIAVFARPQHCPVTLPFAEFGDRAIVVLDKDDPDPTALHVACAWARATTLRASRCGVKTETIDAEQHVALVAQARDKLHQLSTIRRNHTLAKNHIDAAGSYLDTLDSELRDVLARLSQLSA